MEKAGIEVAARNGARPAFLAEAACLSDCAEMERALEFLRGVHVRASLMRLSLPGRAADAVATARAIADAVGHPSIICGTMNDGSLVALYVGPRAHGRIGDLSVEDTMARHVLQAMHAVGLAAYADWVEVSVQNRWTEEVLDLRGWVAELATASRAAA